MSNVQKFREPIMAPDFLRIDGTAVGGGGATPTDTAGSPPTGATLAESAAAVQKVVVTMSNMAINIPAATDVGGTRLFNFGARCVTLVSINADFTVTRDGTNIPAATNVTIACGPVINSSFPMAANARTFMQSITLSADVLTDTVDLNVPTTAEGTPLTGTYPLAVGQGSDFYLNAGASNAGSDDDLIVNGTIEVYFIDMGADPS